MCHALLHMFHSLSGKVGDLGLQVLNDCLQMLLLHLLLLDCIRHPADIVWAAHLAKIAGELLSELRWWCVCGVCGVCGVCVCVLGRGVYGLQEADGQWSRCI